MNWFVEHFRMTWWVCLAVRITPRVILCKDQSSPFVVCYNNRYFIHSFIHIMDKLLLKPGCSGSLLIWYSHKCVENNLKNIYGLKICKWWNPLDDSSVFFVIITLVDVSVRCSLESLLTSPRQNTRPLVLRGTITVNLLLIIPWLLPRFTGSVHPTHSFHPLNMSYCITAYPCNYLNHVPAKFS